MITGPWRATRLWNDVVRTFHAGMPRKKHRKGMRSVEECFTGTEAAEWMHKRLLRNPNFGPNVSRDQTNMLLQKMLRANILVPAEAEAEEEEGGHEERGKFSASGLYKFADSGVEGLRTPGKKTPNRSEKRLELARLDNSYRAPGSGRQAGPPEVPQKPLSGRRRGEMTDEDKENLNRSYFQSLPANSLIVMDDNERVWEAAFLRQLRCCAGELRLPPFQVSGVVYNMTRVSAKGVVQLGQREKQQDLPHWVLSAMKCLANWPRPMRMVNGEESALPSYPGFAQDVFGVVKEYFLETCRTPLVPYGLYDAFVAALVRAETFGTVPARQHRPLALPWPSCSASVATSTPTLAAATPANFECRQSPQPGLANPFLLSGRERQHERVARIRQTLDVPVPSNTSSSFSFDTSNTTLTSSGMSECQPQQQQQHHPVQPVRLSPSMSTTAIMKNFLPPNTCFETAFMHERPVTRIVPQKGSDTIHLNRSVCGRPSRWSYRNMTHIEGDVSNRNDNVAGQEVLRRQPRWRRASRERQSIAIMEGHQRPLQQQQHHHPRRPSPARSEGACAVRRQSLVPQGKPLSSSADDLLDGRRETMHHHQPLLHPSPSSLSDSSRATVSRAGDNIILSKAVRKEKRKQQLKREQQQHRAHSADSAVRGNHIYGTIQVRYRSDRYRSLVVKTPILVDAVTGLPTEGVQCVRAEPYCNSSAGSSREELALTERGKEAAAKTCQLLGLMLPPPNRRKLQLLLKFIKRVSSNQKLKLDASKSNESLALEVFSAAVLRPYAHLCHDAMVGRRITKFFLDCYDFVWIPPESLRKEVEEHVSMR